MRVWSTTLTLFLWSLSTGITKAQSVQLMTPQIRQHLNTYYDALETADAQKALEALNALIAADPNYPHYYGARASVLETLPGVTPDSILAELDKAIHADTTLDQWLIKRANYCLAAGTDRRKFQAVNDLLELCHRDSTSLAHRMALLPVVRLSDPQVFANLHQEAIALAYLQITETPNVADHWYTLASLYAMDKEDMQEEDVLLALGYLEKALSLDPGKWAYAQLRAELYADVLHNYIAAIEDYRYVITLAPSPNAYASLAQVYASSGQKKEAMTIVQEGLILFPGSYILQSVKRSIQ